MKLKKSYEYIIVGSGFGGAFAAYNLAKAGKSVLVVERGIWPKRDETCWDEDKLHLTNPPMYQGQTPVLVDQKDGKLKADWPYDTVGGMSTFYGCAAFRMREEDFFGAPLANSADRDKNSAWPFRYKDMAPYYDLAETLQGVCAVKGEDISEPKKKNYPQKPNFELSPPSKRIWKAAEKLGYHPFHLPMAMNFDGKHGKNKCILCSTCDHYLCKIEAKNDLSVVVLPEAMEMGAEVIPDTRAVKINVVKEKVDSVEIVNQTTGEKFTVKCKNLVVAAGAIGTPHLLLASGIDSMVPAGDLIGRNLMRHSNGVLAGIFPYKTNKINMFQKMIGVSDFYHGDPNGKGPLGPWGLIQEVSSIGKGVIKANAPFGLKNLAATFTDYLSNLLCIAEDMPQYSNRVYVDFKNKDKFGMPQSVIYHRYHQRDLDVRKALYGKAFHILRNAGALMFYPMPIETFSHALGTCKMGTDKETSVVNPEGQVWGIKNLYITDASIMPSGGSVNPSLTIGAVALKISEGLAKK